MFELLNSSIFHNIAVVGDTMIDENFNIKTERINPEFPMLIFDDMNLSEKKLGGAGNLAVQLKYLKSKVHLYGCKNDEFDSLVLQQDHINNLSIKVNDIPIKRRFYSGFFPVGRWDLEKPNYGNQDVFSDRIFSYLYEKKYDAVIFSDYAKGVFNKIPNFSKISGLKVVDPKNGPLEKWIGVDVFKPNYKEAKALTGENDPFIQCKKIKDILNCNVVITVGGEGVYYSIKNDDVVYKFEINENIVIVANVIGAGDCFCAYLTKCLLMGFNLHKSVEYAYRAGKEYVKQWSMNAISPWDLLEDNEKINLIPQAFADRNFKLMFTNGVFDFGLTASHVSYLNDIKNFNGRLLVALNSDDSVKKNKGELRPILSLEERIKIVSSLKFVDYVLSFNEETPLEIIKKCKPDFIFKGGDYKKEDVIGKEYAEVIVLNKYNYKSTTDKIRNLESQQIKESV